MSLFSDKDPDSFLVRWSRLKSRKQVELPQDKTSAEPPPLPAIESLTPAADFSAFMHPRVDDGLRRLALRKLFTDPHFNQMDGLDVYIADFGKPDPLPEGILASLVQAQNLLGLSPEPEAPSSGISGQDVPHLTEQPLLSVTDNTGAADAAPERVRILDVS
jgi:hypothetical protein